MTRAIKGRYKKGVVEPLEPVELAEDEVVEILVPEKAVDSDAVFLSSFGAWEHLVPEEFIGEVYRERVRGSRPPIAL